MNNTPILILFQNIKLTDDHRVLATARHRTLIISGTDQCVSFDDKNILNFGEREGSWDFLLNLGSPRDLFLFRDRIFRSYASQRFRILIYGGNASTAMAQYYVFLHESNLAEKPLVYVDGEPIIRGFHDRLIDPEFDGIEHTFKVDIATFGFAVVAEV